MATPTRLSPADRQFFRLLNDAGSTNPFSTKRREMEQRIITAGDHDAHKEGSIDLVILKVLRRVKELDKSGKANWRRYCEEDSRFVFGALLFDIYYRFTEAFDRLILSQVEAGDKPCTVHFAKDVLGLLCNRGFTERESIRFFAIFYQLLSGFGHKDAGYIETCDNLTIFVCF